LTGWLNRESPNCTLGSKTICSPPTAATPHLTCVASVEIIKKRNNATAIPVACEKPNPLARHPSEAGRRDSSKPRAVDDEIAAIRRLHDFDHVPLGRQIESLIGPAGLVFHTVRKRAPAQQRAQRECRDAFEHSTSPSIGLERIEAILNAAKKPACAAEKIGPERILECIALG
jgi:hypothetical protein